MFDPEEIRRRYSQTEVEVDKFGRAIVVGRLKPSQQARIADIAGPNTGTAFQVVACVRKIDDDDLPPARTRAELEAVMDRLENEGLEAASNALVKLAGLSGEGAPDAVTAAKNS